jgi:hypothetical protein
VKSQIQSTQGGLMAGQAMAEHAARLQEKDNIVLTQWTARPGAIIKLEAIAEATQVRNVHVHTN